MDNNAQTGHLKQNDIYNYTIVNPYQWADAYLKRKRSPYRLFS